MNAGREEDRPIDVEPLLEASLARRAAGDLAGAEALLRQTLEAAPENATGLFLLGISRFEAGDAAEAEQLFERLTLARPDHAQAHFLLASVRHWREARTGAMAAYRRALALEPGHAQALTGLSRALTETGDHSAALETAREAVAAAPDDPAARLALASAWRASGELRNAAEAFLAAATLGPELVAAHVGEALARIDLGEPEAAEAAATRAVALDADLADAWLALGAARRGLHQPGSAREAFERAIALAPDRAAAHLSLGLALIELDDAEAARSALTRALELDPTSAIAHANLSSLYILAARPELAKSHARRALQIDPDLMSAHQNLAALLADEQAWDAARAHRDRAYTERNLVISTAARPLQRVLILTTTESGNIPDRHLIPPASYTRLLWFIEYASERQMAELPAYDVAFNAIGDEDLAGPTAANAARFAELRPTRLLNPPAAISRTRRDRAAELFCGIDGMITPRTVRLNAADLAGAGVRAAGERASVDPPFLLRPIGSHGGKGLRLVEAGSRDEPLPPANAYYITTFNDFRSRDELYRKYRVIFVDREPLPYHLAVSPSWMVHYETSGMEDHPARLAEELRFLDDPAAAIGRDAMQAIAAIGAAMDLDYAGVDFSLTPDGRVLLFEANATMLAHPEAPDGPLAHKNPYIERIFTAFRAMLAQSA